MTPFNLRKRLAKLFGGGEPEFVDDRPSYTVTFRLPDERTFDVTAKKGDTLVLASGRSAWPIETGCADSTCATCQVDILAGEDQLTALIDAERRTLEQDEAPEGRRLGCIARVMGPGVEVGMVNVLGLVD